MNSSTLGFPKEASAPMTADHHNVCKFKGRDDPNYISLINTLRSWATRFNPMGLELTVDDQSYILPAKRLSQILGTRASLENDLFRYRHKNGTCLWFLDNPTSKDWMSPMEAREQRLSVLWLIGNAGTGKSTVSQYFITHLCDSWRSPISCQYHFFSSSDVKASNVAYALRSIAFQLALAL
jgi:hypothetical protein